MTKRRALPVEIVEFFQLYDLHGKGFASKAGWAGQPIPESAATAYTASPKK